MAQGDDARRSVEWAKCVADAAYFAHNFGVIDDTQGLGDGTGSMPFKLWPAQVGVLWQLMAQRLVIILKARQLGISWICCVFALWLCMFQRGKNVLFFSKGQPESDEMLRRVRVMYERLPEWMRLECPLAKEPNKSLIEWANGSRIRSYPATENSGTGEAASLVVMDEAAKLQWADGLYTNLKPTIDGGGQLVILSTAFGVGNLFHRLWEKAAAGLNGFRTIFLPWWSRPNRDAAWYAAKVAEADDPATVKQEYPSNATEAFLVSGRTRFLPEWIDAQAKNVREPLPRDRWPVALRGFRGLSIFEPPSIRPGVTPRACVIGADVAEGKEHGDASDFSLIDAKTWEELASFNGRLEPDEFAAVLKAVSDAYQAPILCERNNHGHAVHSKLRSLGCTRVMKGLDGERGWLTNIQSKPQVIDGLAVALRDGLIKIRTAAALAECKVYRVLEDGKTGAPSGYHDDRVMSRAIAIAGCTLCKRPGVVIVEC